MNFANGTELHAALPVYKGHSTPHYWVVVVKRSWGVYHELGVYHEWVSAIVDSLDATTWDHGNYFHTEAAAMADMLTRSGVFILTYQLCTSITNSDTPTPPGVAGKGTPLP
jgi:hypothetical protein